MPKLIRTEANPRQGPPILVTQTDQTVFAPEGTDRLGADTLPTRQRLPFIGPLNRKGPPLLARQMSQTGFATEWVDRPGGVVPPAPLLMRLGRRFGLKGPPLNGATQKAQTTFPAEGSDRWIDTPITHPLLKFRIGSRPVGPPLVGMPVSNTAFPAEGNDRFVEAPLTHPLPWFRIGRRGPLISAQTQWSLPISGGPGTLNFPTQFSGLRYAKGGSVFDLCLVATADAPSGMGGQPRIAKGGVAYAIYLVETTDPNASPVQFKTTIGIKAIRKKT